MQTKLGSTSSKHARATARAAACTDPPLRRMRVSEIERALLALAELDHEPTSAQLSERPSLDLEAAHKLAVAIAYQQGIT
jgi:hypothetical protein